MPAKSCFMGTNMSKHAEPPFMSSFMLIQKWIQKTTAEQHLKNKKEAFNTSPIEIGPKLRCNEMHVSAFCGHVPSKTLSVFESKALISLVLR